MPVCLYALPRVQTKPALSLLWPIPPSSLLPAAGEPTNQESIAYGIEGGEASVVCEHIGEFATAPIPVSHEPVAAGAGQICRGTPRRNDLPTLATLTTSPLTSGYPSACSLLTWARGEGDVPTCPCLTLRA